ncbi:acetyl-coenzyme A carboxylase carboxyl transferase subunit alpha, chloroplastic [Olea europaea subsp. europaea]|nr:acetyl-coenzyme A carboxylase carboxyl transferase subunit alpha, chloroplastic [Olea europaea subsp. europaea]
MANETGLDFSDQIISLENKYQQALKDLYTHLTPIQRVNIARHPNRPTFLDHVFNITEKFVELHGDRAGYDDPAVVTGLGTINGRSYMFMGHQKGRNTKENIQRNFGMPTPHGYRKALRMMYYADHHGFPIITFIDTPGAYADLKSEELGQGEAIAQNLRTMFGLKVPIVSIVMGEGGSGGALAIGCANKLLMLENAVFYVASPEACAAILWKSAKASPKAAEKLKITAKELCKLEVADGIIPEPLGGAHADSYWTSQQIKTAIVESMDELGKMDTEELLKHRAQKFRKLGGFQEGIPIDPKKKVNMKKKEETIVLSKTSEVELRDEVQKLKQQIQKAGKASADHPEPGLNELIEKLKREIDSEYEEAVKAVGLEDKIVMLREEVAKARNLKDQLTPALKEKIELLNDEFNKNLPSAPNYSSLKYKLDMLKELSNAQNMSEKSTNTDKLKVEIDKRFKEVMDRPDLKLKIETVKGEIAKSGVSELVNLNQDLKEKFVQLSEELESEFKAILESMGLQMYPRSALEAKAKLDTLYEETDMIIEDVINSSNLKDKIDLLKMEVVNAENTPDAKSKSKIQALEAEIKQAVVEAVSSPELKEKYEKLQAQILEATKSSVGSDGSLVQHNLDDQLKHDGPPVEVNSEANRSFV